jgi:hypothetical protein
MYFLCGIFCSFGYAHTDGLTGLTSYHIIEQGVSMSKTVVKIGSFEVDDAHLHATADRAGTLSIPCKSDPDLCMQLDGWDEHTSIPAILNGKRSLLYKQHYDRQADAWVMRLA